MKKTISEEIAVLLTQGATIVADNKFTDKDGNPLKVRQMESLGDPLAIGDTFTVPTQFTTISINIGNGENARPVSFILIEVKSLDGSERNYRLFPNSFAKSVVSIVNGERGPRVKTGGTASELFRQFTEVDEAMNALKGKTIKVSACETVQYHDYNSGELRTTHIYVYDLVS